MTSVPVIADLDTYESVFLTSLALPFESGEYGFADSCTMLVYVSRLCTFPPKKSLPQSAPAHLTDFRWIKKLTELLD